MMTRLALPEWMSAPDDVERVAAEIRAWATSAAMRDLVIAFGGNPADIASLESLDRFSADVWDFRAGRERDQAETHAITTAQTDAVFAQSSSLGLAGRQTPRRDHYDVAILTGGMVRAGIVKPRFVTELKEAGVQFDRVVFLGAHRAFSADERALARSLAVAGDDEVDGMLEGLRREFGSMHAPTVEHSHGPIDHTSWGRWQWNDDVTRVAVVAAASSDPGHRRANTADTFRFWAGRYADAARSVLVITTPVYVPYQAAVAVETLGLESRMMVETVGVSSAASDLGPLTQPFTARHHLQELRSAIRGMASLERALEARSPA